MLEIDKETSRRAEPVLEPSAPQASSSRLSVAELARSSLFPIDPLSGKAHLIGSAFIGANSLK
jgi:hypothetical protein